MPSKDMDDTVTVELFFQCNGDDGDREALHLWAANMPRRDMAHPRTDPGLAARLRCHAQQ